jgi:serine/threonine-protein kinase
MLSATYGEDFAPHVMLRMRIACWFDDRDTIAAIAAKVSAAEAPVPAFLHGYCRFLLGEGDDGVLVAALDFMRQFRNVRMHGLVTQIVIEGFAKRGHHERAAALLAELAEQALVDLEWLQRCPALDGLRGLPGYQAALVQVRERASHIWEV